MQEILLKIVASLENVAVSVVALEAALIQRGQLRSGEVDQYTALPRQRVRQHFSAVRDVIVSLR